MKKSLEIKENILFPIGIGTWGIGGFASINPNNDDNKQIDALVYMLSKGMNFIETNMWYAEGKMIKLLAKALKESGVSREALFITQTIYTYSAGNVIDAKNEIYKLQEILGIDYVDTLQLTLIDINAYGQEKSYELLHSALENKMSRYVSLTNGNLKSLKEFYNIFKESMFSHEVGFNFEIRENISNGVIDYAKENNILNVIYQPLRRNRTANRNWPILIDLSNKYNKTQNQILLNWIMSLGFLPITKSETKAHIDECLGAINFEMEKEDLNKLNFFSPPNYQSPKTFYENEGEGVRVDQLSNVFDDLYNINKQ